MSLRGVTGGLQSVVAGTNVTVDNTDPTNPVVSATSGGVQEHLLLHEESGVPAHAHPYVDRYRNTVTRQNGGSNTGSASLTYINTTTSNNTAADAAQAHTNVQPTLVLNKIIKT